MLIAAGTVSLLIWIYLLLAHGRFWRVSTYTVRAAAPKTPSLIAAIVPARDEAEVVGQCVASLLNQTGGNRIHVFLIDDGSTDGTADIARRAAHAAVEDPELTVISGRPLPAGWSGKLWDVQQGVEQASTLRPDFFLFTDADILHAPASVATLTAIAESGPNDLVSFMVKLHCESFAERALIPAFVFFFFLLYPPVWIADPQRKTAGAAGGSILVRPMALERAGGVAAIRGEVIDDCALAKRVKRSGGRVWLGLFPETSSIRPYGGFAGIGRMISRSAFNQLRHSWLWLLGSLLGLTVTYLLPPVLALFSFHRVPTLLGGAAWLIMAASFLPVVRFYRLNPAWTPALPLIAMFYMGATFHSAIRYWLGRGGEWKGRYQDPARNKN